MYMFFAGRALLRKLIFVINRLDLPRPQVFTPTRSHTQKNKTKQKKKNKNKKKQNKKTAEIR